MFHSTQRKQRYVRMAEDADGLGEEVHVSADAAPREVALASMVDPVAFDAAPLDALVIVAEVNVPVPDVDGSVADVADAFVSVAAQTAWSIKMCDGSNDGGGTPTLSQARVHVCTHPRVRMTLAHCTGHLLVSG